MVIIKTTAFVLVLVIAAALGAALGVYLKLEVAK